MIFSNFSNFFRYYSCFYLIELFVNMKKYFHLTKHLNQKPISNLGNKKWLLRELYIRVWKLGPRLKLNLVIMGFSLYFSDKLNNWTIGEMFIMHSIWILRKHYSWGKFIIVDSSSSICFIIKDKKRSRFSLYSNTRYQWKSIQSNDKL